MAYFKTLYLIQVLCILSGTKKPKTEAGRKRLVTKDSDFSQLSEYYIIL